MRIRSSLSSGRLDCAASADGATRSVASATAPVRTAACDKEALICIRGLMREQRVRDDAGRGTVVRTGIWRRCCGYQAYPKMMPISSVLWSPNEIARRASP